MTCTQDSSEYLYLLTPPDLSPFFQFQNSAGKDENLKTRNDEKSRTEMGLLEGLVPLDREERQAPELSDVALCRA
jgi:hypothetical protein